MDHGYGLTFTNSNFPFSNWIKNGKISVIMVFVSINPFLSLNVSSQHIKQFFFSNS